MGFYISNTVNTRELNDRLRINGSDAEIGRVTMTAMVMSMKPDKFFELLDKVRGYKFTEDDDPYNEHDFGVVEVDGDTFIWKIDYYNNMYDTGVDHAQVNNSEVCKRLLTIMHDSEY
jgi:hypothetical protein